MHFDKQLCLRSIFGFLILLFSAFPAIACETRHLVLNGNLDLGAPLANISLIPDMSTNPSFEELADQAQFITTVEVRDSRDLTHILSFYFYHTFPRLWTVRAVVDGAAVSGGVSGRPALFAADVGLVFTTDGLRQSIGTPDVTAESQWSNGARDASIKLLYALTSFHADFLTSARSDGELGPCRSRSDLDFDFDGIEDKAIWRRSLGTWAVLLTSSGESAALWRQWGLPGDYPFPGDYTGDGTADLVVWRPSNGNWYVCRSETNFDCNQALIQQFGLPGDRPVRADYDSDGILDFSVWRPLNGTFYYRSSANGMSFARQWGLPGDVPLNSASTQ